MLLIYLWCNCKNKLVQFVNDHWNELILARGGERKRWREGEVSWELASKRNTYLKGNCAYCDKQKIAIIRVTIFICYKIMRVHAYRLFCHHLICFRGITQIPVASTNVVPIFYSMLVVVVKFCCVGDLPSSWRFIY